jgi:group I intron endonuclease
LLDSKFNLKQNQDTTSISPEISNKDLDLDNISDIVGTKVHLSEHLKKIVDKIKPEIYYENFKIDRVKIFKDLFNKIGVYCLLNLTNGHYYIGSSTNIANRMKNYLNSSYLKLKKTKNMPISRALLKYGPVNFALLIVEIIPANELAIRETFYIKKLLPYYNVLNQGYISLGFKHSKKTKTLLSKLAKNNKHSDNTKSLISKALLGDNNPFYGKNHSFKSKYKMMVSSARYQVYIYDSLKRLLMILPSARILAKLIKSNSSTIEKYINNEDLFRGGWYFTKKPYNLTENPLINNELIFTYLSIQDLENRNLSANKFQDNLEIDCKITPKIAELKKIISEIKSSGHIKKAIFVYKYQGETLVFVRKFEGIVQLEKELNINNDIIKKHVTKNTLYRSKNGQFLFSYKPL